MINIMVLVKQLNVIFMAKRGKSQLQLQIQWNPSYPGGLVPTGVHISEMSVTMNQIQYALILHISVHLNTCLV